MSPDHPLLDPVAMLRHTCTGAECPICGVFASRFSRMAQPHRHGCTQTPLHPVAFPCYGSERLEALAPVQQQRLAQFRDGCGRPVRAWPQQLAPSVTLMIRDRDFTRPGHRRIVLHQRADNGWWGLPGGAQERGESLIVCAQREAYEETGLQVSIHGLVAVDSDPDAGAICQYPDGNTIQYCNLTFLATVCDSPWTLRRSAESLAVIWHWTCDPLPEPFLVSHAWRLRHALVQQAFVPARQVPVR